MRTAKAKGSDAADGFADAGAFFPSAMFGPGGDCLPEGWPEMSGKGMGPGLGVPRLMHGAVTAHGSDAPVAPPTGRPCPRTPGKFSVLASLMDVLRRQTSDRIVVVSNFTQTLDLIGEVSVFVTGW